MLQLVSFQRFAINLQNYCSICHEVIKLWRVRAIKKVAGLSTRYNILFFPPPTPSPPTDTLQDTCMMAWFAVLTKHDIIFIFMKPTLLLLACFLPIPQFVTEPGSRTHNSFTFVVEVKCLLVYWWSYLTQNSTWKYYLKGRLVFKCGSYFLTPGPGVA